MRKLILFFTLYVTIVPFIFSQKNINVDNVYFRYLVRNFPTDPQNPIFFSYGKDITLTSSASQMLDKDQFMSGLEIQGQRLVEQVKPSEWFVKMRIDNAKIESVEMITKESTVNDRRVYTYYMEPKVSGSSYITISKDGKEIWQTVIRKRDNIDRFQTKEYLTPKECKENWNLNKESFIDQLTNDFAKKDVQRATQIVSSLFGFQLVSVLQMLETMSTKKHPENEIFRSQVSALKTKLSSLNGNQPLSESEMKPFIDYFKSIPEKYPDLVLKSDIKIRYAAYYNLAQIYAAMDKFEEAINYCNLVVSNKFDAKDGSKLKEELIRAQIEISDKPIKVRQFIPEDYFGKQ